MSYKLRNSIALGVILVLILGVGIYIRAFSLPGKLSKIEVEIKRIDEELQNTPSLINQFNDLSVLLDDTKKRWESRYKEIPPADITAQTYAYFSGLMDLSGDVKLDLIYNGVQQKGNYGYNIYDLKGEARFADFYRFIWYLENGRRLYKIQSLNLKGLEVAETEKEPGHILVTYQMTLYAYFSSMPELATPGGERPIAPNYLAKDPFGPVITTGIPPNLRSLVEVERSDLKAVIPGKAFLVDQNNVFKTLQEGDEVYLGYVTKIVPEEGRIECTLNKGGIIEKVELKIRYGAAQNVVQK
ncbi:MAG: hypothetical protein HY708_00355 [Ignavibacteriae bacterium]|nr:hypothetical protein [Ignavibacteriota bacterium]